MEDRRGQGGGGMFGGGGFSFPGMGGGGGGGKAKLGIPMIILAVVAFFLTRGGGGGGIDITDVMGQMTGGASSNAVPAAEGGAKDEQYQYVRAVGTLLQDFWTESFAESGQDYRPATLVIFDAPTSTGCGMGTPETGPFYCPADDRVYIDFGFYEQLEQQLGFDGDFAMAYVIAHEWGHHVQNVLGINDEVQRRAGGRQDAGADSLSVKLELQADCFAGVWAKSAFEDERLEAGDFNEAIEAAQAVGDDRIQERTQGRINPESFTHGSAEQREQWFRTGYDTADPGACDTFR